MEDYVCCNKSIYRLCSYYYVKLIQLLVVQIVVCLATGP
jgi:hypothetical protein